MVKEKRKKILNEQYDKSKIRWCRHIMAEITIENESGKMKETGVLSYIEAASKKDRKEHFYGDALDRAFYEMYILEA